jgi:hypothetical protein
VLWPQRGCKQELPAASGPIFRSINKNYFRTFSLQEPAEATPDLHLSLVHSVVKVPPPELHLSICRAWGTLPCTNVKLQVSFPALLMALSLCQSNTQTLDPAKSIC